MLFGFILEVAHHNHDSSLWPEPHLSVTTAVVCSGSLFEYVSVFAEGLVPEPSEGKQL